MTLDSKTLQAGQANNAYVFPGLGLGVILSEAKKVTDGMLLAAARTLAKLTTEEDLKNGTLFPPLKNIRKVSAAIAKEVIIVAGDENVFGKPQPPSLDAFIQKAMYEPAAPKKGAAPAP